MPRGFYLQDQAQSHTAAMIFSDGHPILCTRMSNRHKRQLCRNCLDPGLSIEVSEPVEGFRVGLLG